MPDPAANYFPKKSSISSLDTFNFERLDPGKLNDWLVDNDGYIRIGRINWDSAVKGFYYYGWPWPDYYTYLHRNYYCPGYTWPYHLAKNMACYKADWIDPDREPELPTAGEMLDYDLEHNQPDIVRISGTDLRGRYHSKHFVLIAGYDPASASYSAYDPGQRFSGGNYYVPRPLAEMYIDHDLVRIYRFFGWEGKTSPMVSEIGIRAHSPVEMEIIDPKGRRTGYEPSLEGSKLRENPMSLYHKEESPSSLDGADMPFESVKILTVVEPTAGNYIVRIFGTGDGPYTIDMEFTKSDGTPNLVTTLTGTATPGLAETYRITYSPTGEASLSQTNQAPVANAGSNQTGEQSYEITLDGSASSDPDGDPLKYTWSFISRPPNSAAAFSDVNATKPTFTPDLPGTYALQLVVNDYFTDSEFSNVTITATPVQSRISVTPNFSSPLNEGSGFISFDVNNIGRIGVSSGSINLSLTDPDGQVVSNGSQAFSLSVGETRTVSVPVRIPSLV